MAASASPTQGATAEVQGDRSAVACGHGGERGADVLGVGRGRPQQRRQPQAEQQPGADTAYKAAPEAGHV